MTPVAEITGTGRYTPDTILTNAELERRVDTSDQWIRERTGIRERRIARADETIAQMGKVACEQVLASTGVSVDDIDTLIVATASPDRLLPSQACDLQATLGAVNAAAFDVSAACSGFIYALTVAEGLVASGTGSNVLVVGAERLSTITNQTDRGTCILFGDGVGATLVRKASSENRGILSSYVKSDGRQAELLYRPAGGATRPPSDAVMADGTYYLTMSGRETFKSAVLSMSDACAIALDRAGLTIDDVDLLVPHQANIRIIEATAKHTGLSMDNVFVNVDRYGNTSAASIPIALDEAVRSGIIHPGSLVLMVAFGGGLTWGSMAVRW